MNNNAYFLAIYILIYMHVLFVAACSQEQNTEPDKKQDSVEHVTFPAPSYHPEWFKNSFMDIADDVKEAKGEGKRLIVYFYQDGCPYCKKLIEHNLAQAEVTKLARQKFEIIAINIFGSVEVTDIDGEELSEKDFARKYNVNFTPTMITYNEEGDMIFRMNGYYSPDKFMAMLNYLAEKQETRLKFLDFFEHYRSENKPDLLDLNKFENNYKTAKIDFEKLIQAESKPVAVFFEEANCETCNELHDDILQRKETKQLLNKFTLAVIDVNSNDEIITPQGIHTTSSKWVMDKDIQFIPTILFFDMRGDEVFRIDGYVKAFHLQSAFDYVLSESYGTYSGFQPFLHDRAAKLESDGVEVEIMK